MEIKILEDSTNKLVFEVTGATHTLCSALKRELWTNSDVKIAGYSIAHPLVGKPVFTVETKKGKNPRKVITSSVKSLKKKIESLKSKSKKIR